jgi:uncharacterized protein
MRGLRFILDFPKLSVALCLLLTGFLGAQLAALQTNPSSYLLDASHPARIIDADMHNLFNGTGASITIVIKPQSGNVYQTPLLELVAQLTGEFERLNLTNEQDVKTLQQLAARTGAQEQVNGILQNGLQADDTQAIDALLQTLQQRSAKKFAADIQFLSQLKLLADPVARVRSLTTAEDLEDIDDSLESVLLLDGIPRDDAAFAQLRKALQDNPMLLGTYVSKDHLATSIQIEMRARPDNASLVARAHEKVMAIVETVEAAEPDVRISVGGSAVIFSVLATYIQEDNNRFFPLVLLVIVTILALSFRNLEGVLLTLLVAIVSLVSTLGLLPLLGIQQNMITTMIPIFVMAASVADAIHFLTHFYRNYSGAQDSSGQQLRAAIETTWRKLFRAMTFTSITTALGFFSLSYTDIVFVKEFGMFVAAGVVFAYAYTLVLIPALLMLRKKRKVLLKEHRQSWLIRGFCTLAQGLGSLSLQRRGVAAIGLLLIAAGSAYLAQQVRVDYEGIVMYPQDSRVRMDDAAIKQHFKGLSPLSIRLMGKKPGAIYDTDVIRYIDQVEALAKTNPHVDVVLSPNSFLKRLDQILRDGERDVLAADMNSELASQFYLLYDNSAGQDIRDVVDVNYQEGRIVIMLDTDRSSAIRGLFRQIERIPVPDNISIAITGSAGLAVTATDAIVEGQVNSLGLSAVMMLVIMAVLFRSLRVGIIAIVPLGFTLLINFALLRVFNMDLDVATSLIAAIVLGISIDYGIHFIENVLRAERDGMDRSQAILHTLGEVSQPIIVNSLSLSAGFLVLTVSNLQPLVDLGVLIGMAMIVSALATLVILPLLLSIAGTVRARVPVAEPV